MWIARGDCGWTLRCAYEIPRVRRSVAVRGSPASIVSSAGETHSYTALGGLASDTTAPFLLTDRPTDRLVGHLDSLDELLAFFEGFIPSSWRVLSREVCQGLGFSLHLFIGCPLDHFPLDRNLKIAYGNPSAFVVFTWLLLVMFNVVSYWLCLEFHKNVLISFMVTLRITRRSSHELSFTSGKSLTLVH
jgi:hypothetical protein